MLMAPRLIESIFQAAAFWNVKQKGAMAFPLGVGSVTTYRVARNRRTGKRLYAVVNTPDDGQSVRRPGGRRRRRRVRRAAGLQNRLAAGLSRGVEQRGPDFAGSSVPRCQVGEE